MQLKKRFSVRKGVAAGAMAVAMFATSMPAMASNGHGQEFGIGLSLPSGSDRGGKQADSPSGAALKADLKELRSFTREVRNDLRSGWKEKNQFDKDATSSAQVAARKLCRKTAKDAFADAVAKARDERDSGLKSAVDAYLAALKSARSAYQAAVGSGASTANSDATDAARLTYRTAIKEAQKAYRAAKAGVIAAYRTDLEAARTAENTAKEACRL